MEFYKHILHSHKSAPQLFKIRLMCMEFCLDNFVATLGCHTKSQEICYL